MCGIAGFRAAGNEDELRREAAAMSSCIRHRGPDDDGLFVDANAGVALAFRRLAIIDLTPAGAQPMTSASGRYTIVFNGEVYNFERLRRELPERAWRGHSDTEVMLACIEEWGLRRACEAFIGMFAFALWDREQRALFLVRDRLGVKPLYYAQTTDLFLFASELSAIRSHPRFDARVSREAAVLYARYGYIPQPWSIYEGVRKLPPGSILTFRDDRVTIEEYWSAAEVVRNREAFAGSEADAVRAVEELLDDAVRLRMISDVPLGVFLSGGIDSTLVTALMQRAQRAPVKTFTIGFEDARYDEAAHASAVAKQLGTAHTEHYVTAREALDVIPMLPAMYGEPFGDSSAIPTYLVSKLARQSVTVALSGDGGDELFGGYHRYFLGLQAQQRAARVPRALRPLAALVAKRAGKQGLADALRARDAASLYEKQMVFFNLPSTLPHPFIARDAWPSLDATELAMYLDSVTYMPDDILAKVDRASMAVSLEVREPLLDHRLYELAWSLPLSMKIRDGGGKWILKRLLRTLVPPQLVDREKYGFGLPIGEWLRGPLRDWCESLLRDVDIFDAQQVQTLWRAHLAGADRERALWFVLMWQAWRATTGGPPAAGGTPPDPSWLA